MIQKQSFVGVLAATFIAAITACSWTDDDADAWYGAIMVGSIVGFLVGLVLTVLVALPLCCGILKGPAKILAGVAIGLGIFVIFIPLIAGKASTDAAISKMCDKCGTCEPDEEQKAKDAIGALGVIVAYTVGHGYLCVIIGVLAACLGCCVCCKCCKMKDKENGAPPVVVGSPA